MLMTSLRACAGFVLGPEQLSQQQQQQQQQYRTNLVRLSSTGELNPHSTLNRPSSARITVRAQVRMETISHRCHS